MQSLPLLRAAGSVNGSHVYQSIFGNKLRPVDAFLYIARCGGEVNNRIFNSLVLLSALLGTCWAAAADEDDRARHDRDRPVAKLFDANGKLVGKMVYFQGPGVVLNIHGAPVYAGITRIGDGYLEQSATDLKWSSGTGAFAGPNCSGTIYVTSEAGVLRPTATVRNGSTVTLYVASGGRQQTVLLSSWGEPGADCFSARPVQLRAWAVESIFDLSQNYPEPLRIGP
jgi:hypothetical protein